MARMKGAVNFLLSALFEPPCVACKQTLRDPVDGAVCAGCWAALRRAPRLERRDADAHIAWWCAVDHYEGPMKEIIHALKYERRRSIASPLGALMRERGSDLLRDAGVVVPVPLHSRREYQRGFNQAEDLARHLGLPVARMLTRVKHTHSQIDLPKHARAENVRSAFALVEPKGSTLQELVGNCSRRNSCRGEPSGSPATVVLVDDVATTGATLAECALVLKAAGVREVRAITAARVVNERR